MGGNRRFRALIGRIPYDLFIIWAKSITVWAWILRISCLFQIPFLAITG